MDHIKMLTNIKPNELIHCYFCDYKFQEYEDQYKHHEDCSNYHFINILNDLTLLSLNSVFYARINFPNKKTIIYQDTPNKPKDNKIILPFNVANSLIQAHRDKSLDHYINKRIDKWKILI